MIPQLNKKKMVDFKVKLMNKYTHKRGNWTRNLTDVGFGQPPSRAEDNGFHWCDETLRLTCNYALLWPLPPADKERSLCFL